MAKCPECQQRKGKRSCPALGAAICPACCGDLRGKTIDCPPDCTWLEGETYQRSRRREKSMARGRALLDFLRQHFRTEPSWQFAMRLCLEIHAWTLEEGSVDDEAVAAALEGLHGSLGRIVLTGSETPLARFLGERVEESPELATGPGFGEEERRASVSALAGLAAPLKSAKSPALVELIDGFFRELDIVRDLGYGRDLDNEREPESRPSHDFRSGYERRPSGLIVPPPGS